MSVTRDTRRLLFSLYNIIRVGGFSSTNTDAHVFLLSTVCMTTQLDLLCVRSVLVNGANWMLYFLNPCAIIIVRTLTHNLNNISRTFTPLEKLASHVRRDVHAMQTDGSKETLLMLTSWDTLFIWLYPPPSLCILYMGKFSREKICQWVALCITTKVSILPITRVTQPK